VGLSFSSEVSDLAHPASKNVFVPEELTFPLIEGRVRESSTPAARPFGWAYLRLSHLSTWGSPSALPIAPWTKYPQAVEKRRNCQTYAPCLSRGQ